VLVENISLPPAVSEALDKRTSMGMTGNLDHYLQYQTGVAMEESAKNPSGGASDGIGMGVGLAMANRMDNSMRAAAPPPIPAATEFHIEHDGKAAGPYSIDEIKGLISGQQLTPATLVWSPALTSWTAASNVAALQTLFSSKESTPPPLPTST